MEIKRAAILGFCFGVRRAVELAEKALDENKGKKVFSLGPLIHNEAALKKLSDKGLQIIEENLLSELPESSVVIIRAHGVAPQIIDLLEKKNSIIIDATCPRVKASQKMVEKYTCQNDYVILTGDKNHGEVKGIAGYAGKNFSLVENIADVESLDIAEPEKINVILLSQTTYSQRQFDEIEKSLKAKFPNIAVMNTICPATKERQNSLLELCAQVEGVIVIGGKNSANTIRLFQTAKNNCKNAVHIQSASEIPEEFRKLRSVGITAGASTPDEIIGEVEQSLS